MTLPAQTAAAPTKAESNDSDGFAISEWHDTDAVMAKLNASVRLVGRYSEKLAVCEKWGIKHRHVDDVGRRSDQDIVVDCTGSPDGLDLALRLVRPRGTVVLKTLLKAPVSNWRGALVVAAAPAVLLWRWLPVWCLLPSAPRPGAPLSAPQE